MHAMWKGTIQIAKIQIPIKLYAATEDKELSLKTVHSACGGAVSHLKYCQACEEKLETDHIRKVYDLGGGHGVELTEEEMKELTPASNRTFLIEQFADEAEISRIRLKKHYYVGTDELGEETFRLFHAGLLRARKIGLGYITLRSAQSLAALWPTADGLVLSTMLYEDEIRPMESIAAPSNRVRKHLPEDHLFVFEQLIRAMSAEFVGSKFPNSYAAALKALIENKIAKLAPREKAKEAPLLPRETRLEDLLSTLTASLELAKNGADAFAPPEDLMPH